MYGTYLEPSWEERNKRKMFTFLKQNIIADDSLCPNRNTWKWAKKTAYQTTYGIYRVMRQLGRESERER